MKLKSGVLYKERQKRALKLVQERISFWTDYVSKHGTDAVVPDNWSNKSKGQLARHKLAKAKTEEANLLLKLNPIQEQVTVNL